MSSSEMIIKQGNDGLEVRNGPPNCETIIKLSDKNIRCFHISDDGRLLAIAEPNIVKVYSCPGFDLVMEKDCPGVQFLKISPKGSVLATWTPYKGSAKGIEGEPNLCLYHIQTNSLLQTFVQKKMSQWCPQWSLDEAICIRHLNQELLVYESNNFELYVKKLFTQKVAEFSVVTNKKTGIHYFACYSIGTKGQPSFVRIYEYPQLGAVIANKSFFKADSVKFIWNSKGDALLLLCATDVDKTGKSYYGEQTLHYLDITGVTFVVKLMKAGPVHSVEWSPAKSGPSVFLVVYGFLPAKATMFNCKSDIVFEFGEPSMVNQISFNPFGSLVAFSGFGNLRAGVFIWDVQRKLLIAHFKCAETTDIMWAPNGKELITATTSPRLRVGNGFKIWSFDGTLIFEHKYQFNGEMYKVAWWPSEEEDFAVPAMKDKLPNLKKEQAKTESSKYVPPSARKSGENKANQSNIKPSTLSEKEKKVKALEKKLVQIEKLKELQASGKELEKNQLDKLKKEDELQDELVQLQIS